jgi:Uma2 family endonuclease
MTIEEFARAPLQGSWELIDGEPVELMPSAGRSGWISALIVSHLMNHVRANQLGWVFSSETGFVLFDDRQTVRAADAAVVLRDRLAGPPDSFVPLAPDLAVEVLSPSDCMADAMSKVTMYLQAGVRLVWLVDPAERTVTIYRPDGGLKMLGESDTLDGSHVLPGFSLPVVEIFA